jgi:predicted DNA-binding protein (UPF0251 family)
MRTAAKTGAILRGPRNAPERAAIVIQVSESFRVADWQLTEAASILGIGQTTLRKWLRAAPDLDEHLAVAALRPSEHLVPYGQSLRTVSEWAAKLGISRSVFRDRLKVVLRTGTGIERLMKKKEPSLASQAAALGISRQALHERLGTAGWGKKKALSQPRDPRRRSSKR